MGNHGKMGNIDLTFKKNLPTHIKKIKEKLILHSVGSLGHVAKLIREQESAVCRTFYWINMF